MKRADISEIRVSNRIRFSSSARMGIFALAMVILFPKDIYLPKANSTNFIWQKPFDILAERPKIDENRGDRT